MHGHMNVKNEHNDRENKTQILQSSVHFRQWPLTLLRAVACLGCGNVRSAMRSQALIGSYNK
jgi:hypothetical protein